jgi:hypothetical protein
MGRELAQFGYKAVAGETAPPVVSARLYFEGRHPLAQVDPRDIPRNHHGYPLPNYQVVLGRNALEAAISGSLIEASITGKYTEAFPEEKAPSASLDAEEASSSNPPPVAPDPKLGMGVRSTHMQRPLQLTG